VNFRLLTYNIMKGGRGRVEAIAAVIDACQPDIVLLQEATDALIVRDLAGLTGMADFSTFSRQSLAFLSRKPVAGAQWIRPRFSRHAFVEVELATPELRIFGVHLSAVHAAWTEQRRVFELGALLRTIHREERRFHVLVGDFNTVAPGDTFDLRQLPLRLQPFVWMSGGRIRWRTIQRVLDAGYVDAFRLKHPEDAGVTMPAWNPHVRLDYVFVPSGHANRIVSCDVVKHPQTINASDHLPVVANVTV
jgi:endonuclease/exonuclease/phosphatase family metal-dependent hydrolase